MGKMGKMKTYEFTYDESIDGFGSTQFCAEKRFEAVRMFREWQQDEGIEINSYAMDIVYDDDDAVEYGDRYFYKRRKSA